jgi:predicted RNase H-like HicB family nuclease
MVRLGKYAAVVERDPESGWWLGTIEPEHPDLKGMTTQAKTLPTLRRRVREMLGLEAADADKADIEFRYAGKAVRIALSARQKAAKAAVVHRAAQEAQRAAARALVKAGVGVRDASELLGVSHQRVQQLVHA